MRAILNEHWCCQEDVDHDVAEMVQLKACGWGVKRIARQLGCSHHTVKGYLAAGGSSKSRLFN